MTQIIVIIGVVVLLIVGFCYSRKFCVLISSAGVKVVTLVKWACKRRTRKKVSESIELEELENLTSGNEEGSVELAERQSGEVEVMKEGIRKTEPVKVVKFSG